MVQFRDFDEQIPQLEVEVAGRYGSALLARLQALAGSSDLSGVAGTGGVGY